VSDEKSVTLTVDALVVNEDEQTQNNLVQPTDPIEIVVPDTPESPIGDGSSGSGSTDRAKGVFVAIEQHAPTIISLMLIIAILGGMATKGIRDPFLLGITAILLMIVLVIAGFLDVMILLYVILSIIGIAVIIYTLKPRE
jgi:hypothetical protein